MLILYYYLLFIYMSCQCVAIFRKLVYPLFRRRCRSRCNIVDDTHFFGGHLMQLISRRCGLLSLYATTELAASVRDSLWSGFGSCGVVGVGFRGFYTRSIVPLLC